MAQGLKELFKHNLWANLHLLDVCAGLSLDYLDASASGTYGTVKDTWFHLLGAEAGYVATLTNQLSARRYRPGDPFPGFEPLRQCAHQSGESLITYAEQFDISQMVQGVWQGKPYRMRAIIPMMQAINHATEHRAHIITILSQQGVEPPVVDIWAYNDTLNRPTAASQ
jgi:uncharacterized damage-inducible protein DinB